MAEDLLSIIVPVYNVEEYLDQCIQSVLEQKYQNIEVILVMGDSSDRSSDICKNYASVDKRIKLVRQQNRGLADARKCGFAAVTGRYLGFVDSDDYIDRDLYQLLMERVDDFDLVISGHKAIKASETCVCYNKIPKGSYCTDKELKYLVSNMLRYSDDLSGENGIYPNVWSKLFRTDIAKTVFKKIDTSLSILEDVDFTYRYILECKSILVTDVCGYCYRIRDDSLFNAANKEYLENVNRLYNALESAFIEHPQHKALIEQLQFFISSLIAMSGEKMGFEPKTRCKRYIFPFLNLLEGKHIILYGAGKVGQDFYWQIIKLKICEIDLWVSKSWERERSDEAEVFPVETIFNSKTYEYIVIAVLQADMAAEIKQELLALGVSKEKILWKAPIDISCL